MMNPSREPFSTRWWSPALFEAVSLEKLGRYSSPVAVHGAIADRLTVADAASCVCFASPSSSDSGAEARPVAAQHYPPKPNRHVRLVLISDTHNAHRLLEARLPPKEAEVDILVHAGDFSDVGRPEEVEDFAAWLGELKAAQRVKESVVIAGNHDLLLDRDTYPTLWRRFGHRTQGNSERAVEQLRAVATYLDHEPATVCGLRFFGTPYQPEFHDWAFNLPRGPGGTRAKWATMTAEYEREPFDVLVSHGPPLGHGDMVLHRGPHGCWDLLDWVEAHPPSFVHVFGHMHEGYGATTNGRTLFTNPSTMNYNYDEANLQAPMVLDVPLPSAGEAARTAWTKRLQECLHRQGRNPAVPPSPTE